MDVFSRRELIESLPLMPFNRSSIDFCVSSHLEDDCLNTNSDAVLGRSALLLSFLRPFFASFELVFRCIFKPYVELHKKKNAMKARKPIQRFESTMAARTQYSMLVHSYFIRNSSRQETQYFQSISKEILCSHQNKKRLSQHMCSCTSQMTISKLQNSTAAGVIHRNLFRLNPMGMHHIVPCVDENWGGGGRNIF